MSHLIFLWSFIARIVQCLFKEYNFSSASEFVYDAGKPLRIRFLSTLGSQRGDCFLQWLPSGFWKSRSVFQLPKYLCEVVWVFFTDYHQQWAPVFPAVCQSGVLVSVLQDRFGLTAPTQTGGSFLGCLELVLSRVIQKVETSHHLG